MSESSTGRSYKSEFFEADCLVDTLAGLISDARETMRRDIRMEGRNKACKILDEALQHIKEYSDE